MTDIYNVVVFHKAYAGTLGFQFVSAGAADDARLAIESAIDNQQTVSVEDGFGVKARINGEDFSAVVMTHLNRHFDGQRHTQLLQQHAQIKLNQALQEDPVLKLHASRQQPGFNGNPQFRG
jgi:hypothetical protein